MYLYPAKTNTPTRTLLMWVQEIPAGGRSGKQRTQGGRMHYVMEGQGYTVIDGIKHEWEQGDIVLIPIKPSGGTEHQHFNADPHHPVQLLVAEPNWYAIFGVDMAGGFEVTEDQPDYQR
jgi:gentisate 1,2-dioxygenase